MCSVAILCSPVQREGIYHIHMKLHRSGTIIQSFQLNYWKLVIFHAVLKGLGFVTGLVIFMVWEEGDGGGNTVRANACSFSL